MMTATQAFLRIHGPDVDPDAVTDALRLTPTHMHLRGQPWNDHPRYTTYKQSMWLLRSPLPDTAPLSAHLEALMGLADPHRDAILSWASAAAVDLRCVLYDQPGFALSRDLIRQLTTFGAALHVSVHPADDPLQPHQVVPASLRDWNYLSYALRVPAFRLFLAYHTFQATRAHVEPLAITIPQGEIRDHETVLATIRDPQWTDADPDHADSTGLLVVSGLLRDAPDDVGPDMQRWIWHSPERAALDQALAEVCAALVHQAEPHILCSVILAGDLVFPVQQLHQMASIGAHFRAQVYADDSRQDVLSLLEDLHNPDPAVRRQRALGLLRWGSANSLPALLNALEDDDPQVRDVLVQAIVRFHTRRTGVQVVRRLLSATRSLRLRLIGLLGEIGDRNVGDLLRDLREKTQDEAFAATLADAIQRIGERGG